MSNCDWGIKHLRNYNFETATCDPFKRKMEHRNYILSNEMEDSMQQGSVD